MDSNFIKNGWRKSPPGLWCAELRSAQPFLQLLNCWRGLGAYPHSHSNGFYSPLSCCLLPSFSMVPRDVCVKGSNTHFPGGSFALWYLRLGAYLFKYVLWDLQCVKQHVVVYEKFPLAACAAKTSWSRGVYVWGVRGNVFWSFFFCCVHCLLNLDSCGVLSLSEIECLKYKKTVLSS